MASAIFSALRLSGVLCLASVFPAAAEERFPFLIPGDDATATATDLSGLSPRAAGADGFVRIRDGHFATDAGRLKLWGVNTCFNANFPAPKDAEKVAAHLAKLGFNVVRMHHHDTSAVPRGLWGPLAAGVRPLDPAQLDRQDYFLAQLHQRGLYANLNLHVGRALTEAEGFNRTDLPYATRMDKYLLYFEPQLRSALKDFCRAYLEHYNPYRKLRRVDDPGIAVLEITNENSFSRDGAKIAAALPEPHRGEFVRQWNAWLARRYAKDDVLRQAWSGGSEPLGSVLADSTVWSRGLGTWRLHQSKQFPVEARPNAEGPSSEMPALVLRIGARAPELHQHELQIGNLTLERGRLYTVEFWLKADAPRPVLVDVSNAGPANWNSVGYAETIEAGPVWRQIRQAFRVSEKLSGAARICFKFGGHAAGLSLAGVRLQRGGDMIVIPSGQSLAERNIAPPVEGWSPAALRDVRQFMVETETEFIRELTQFLKKDLGVKIPITASQINYHGEEIVAATCDFTDIHAYWQHPHFPGKPWDPENWRIANTPMEAAPAGDALLARAPWRLHDRPFTISEWNIPDPNDYAASVVPFVALVAGLQDWDGVYFFQYSNGGSEWFSERLNSYFSFNMQPAKLALLVAGAHLFRRGDLAPLSARAESRIGERLPATLGLEYRLGQSAAPGKTPPPAPAEAKHLASSDRRAEWDARDPRRAMVRVNTPATRGVWGLVAGQTFDLGGVRLQVGANERDYAVLLCTSLDGQPLETAKRVLVTAVGSAQNQDMTWNAARTSVGRAWGKAPAVVNGIAAELDWPGRLRRVQALDGRGEPVSEVPVVMRDGRSVFQLGPEHRTLWYLLTAE